MQSTVVLKRIVRSSAAARLHVFRRQFPSARTTVQSFHSFSYQAQRPTPPVLAPMAAAESADEDLYYDEDEEIERFTAECIKELLPRYAQSFQRKPCTLDLELGEDDDSPDGSWEEEEGVFGIQEEEEVDKFEVSSPKKLSSVELLAKFDPQNPPSSDNMEDLQLWLECEAQQEAVARYQKIIDSARQRKDYSSLGLVQKQVLWWFQPLSEALEKKQKEYMLKELEGEGAEAKRASKKYGPYLCTLPPGKLAVIAAHAAIMHTLTQGAQQGEEGIPFVSMAKRLGEAVEEEVVIQRVLHKRFRDAQEKNRLSKLETPAEDASEEDTPTEVEVPASEMVEGDSTTAPDQSSPSSAQNWAYSASHLQNFMEEIKENKPKKRRVVSYAVWRARQILEKDDEWSVRDKIQLGAALFQVLLDTAVVKDGKQNEPAFIYEKRWTQKDKLKSFVVMNDRLQKMIVSDRLQSFTASTTRQKPMILPPKPWTQPDDGGYLWLKMDLMRHHGSNTQREALDNANLSTVYDGLNALGRVPWQINKRLLRVAERCWDDNIPIGDIPQRNDYEVPPQPIPPEPREVKPEKGTPDHKLWVDEAKKYRDAQTKYDRLNQRNMDLRSLRCSAILKLDQAAKFEDFEKIYFPYNMDFRGRAYPCTPHLSNVGSDLCRGMLKFAEAKPLGPNGLYWLKVHLANFAGKDKVSFDERAAYVDEVMDKVRASVGDPFSGERWWMSLEDPFQGLATCYEIVDAIDSGDPESFMCSLPVHMDGSCNGLQHYAALGRDRVGGKAVNLCAMDAPQDVYSGVMHEVIRRVADEAARSPDVDTSDLDSLSRKQKKELADNRAAKLVDGLIDRGVVKRTVMTSVYGVTYIGARQQIQEKIESKLEAKGLDIDELNFEIFQASGYLARITMDVMGDLFTGAKETMNWLTTCARMISQHGYPVAWCSPIGLPAIQPYRLKKPATLLTLMQAVTLVEESDDLPIHKARQVTAFPPNYVHSLDSSHMLFTALEMDARGLTFSAVHDSFWTHACDIDEMNDVLRNTFVDLYEKPLLEKQKESWEMRYPDLEFPDLPERGELDLNEVKSAKYFFQ